MVEPDRAEKIVLVDGNLSSANEPFVILCRHSPPLIVPRSALTEKYAKSLTEENIAVPVEEQHQKIAWSLFRQSNPNHKYWKEHFIEMMMNPSSLRPGWVDFLEITVKDYADYQLALYLERQVEDSLEFLRNCPLARTAHCALIEHTVRHWLDWYQKTGSAIEVDSQWRDPFERAVQEGMSVVKMYLYKFMAPQ